MRLAVFALLFLAVGLAVYASVDSTAVASWGAEKQRAFQNHMAGAIRALRMGDPGALAALLTAAGIYGFVHALGPGHGKYVIGGVGLGSSVSAPRLLGVAFASSLAQALWAILLVYGAFFLLEVSARRVTAVAEDYLAPLSYLAIATVGVVLAWRGARTLARSAGSDHAHHHAECGCHGHALSRDDVERLGSIRNALLLIASVAVRPCTGAIFLLVIAWQMDIRAAGAAAVIVMGLGTAALTSLVAISSIAARRVTFASADRVGAVALAVPTLQILAGGLIVWISLMLLGFAA